MEAPVSAVSDVYSVPDMHDMASTTLVVPVVLLFTLFSCTYDTNTNRADMYSHVLIVQ